MAARQSQNIRLMNTPPKPVGTYVRKNRVRLIVLAAIGLVIVLAVSIHYGVRYNNNLKASQLFSQARSAQDYQAILEKFPGSYLAYDALLNLGHLAHDQGKSQDALAWYQRAFELQPRGFKGASALCAMGQIKAEGKEYEEACSYFSRAMDLDPKGAKAPEALAQWARVLRTMGKGEEAQTRLEELRKEFPGSPWAQEAAENNN